MPGSSLIDDDVRKAMSRSFLSTLAPAQLDMLFRDAQRINVPAGTTIYREQDATRLALLVSGLVRSYRVQPDGTQITLIYSHTGDILGILHFSNTPWHITAETVLDSSFLAFSTESFVKFFRSNAEACWSLFQNSCQRHGIVINELPYHSQGPADRRIARYLLEIASPCQDGHLMLVTVTHQAIADAVSLTRETVTRTLNEFRKSGLVVSSQRNAMQVDRKGLHLIASSGDDSPVS